jgi:hypothetical protein
MKEEEKEESFDGDLDKRISPGGDPDTPVPVTLLFLLSSSLIADDSSGKTLLGTVPSTSAYRMI